MEIPCHFHWPSISMDILIYQTLLWWRQSPFMLTNLEYHINFEYTSVTETWLSLMGYLKVTTWHVFKLSKSFRNFWITITLFLYIFRDFGLALTHTGWTLYQYHKVFADISLSPLCSMNMDAGMALVFFDDVKFIKRLLLPRALVYFILPYICNNILINIYPDDWRFAIRWQFDVFQTIMQFTPLSSSGWKRNWLIIFLSLNSIILWSHLEFRQSKVFMCLHKHAYRIAWPLKHMFRHQFCLHKCISSKDIWV